MAAASFVLGALVALVGAILLVCKQLDVIFVVRYYARLIGGWLYFRSLKNNTRRFKKIQEETLLRILRCNENTEHGRKLNLRSIRTREEYVRQLPVTSYKEIQPYMDRMYSGETDILFTGKVQGFVITSGTTGKGKLFGHSYRNYNYMNTYLGHVFGYVPSEYSLSALKPNKILRLLVPPVLKKSEYGIEYGPLSAYMEPMTSIDDFCSTPKICNRADIEPPALTYLHFLIALQDPGIVTIQTTFPGLLKATMDFLDSNWPRLVKDINEGSISVDIPEDIRKELVGRHVRPNAERAKQLTREFEAGSERILKRIWPNLSVIMAITGGPFKMYTDMLNEKHTKGIPFYSFIYAASEGVLGTNLNFHHDDGSNPKYILQTGEVFFELIPLDQTDEEDPKTIFPEQAKLGEQYEVVVTNSVGLYRYAMGDVVEVVGFYNETPLVRILYRKGSLMNILGEKVTDIQVCDNLTAAIRDVDNSSTLVEFTCAESGRCSARQGEVPHHVIFFEVAGTQSFTADQLLQLQEKYDQDLQKNAGGLYQLNRKAGKLGKPFLRQLRPGTFDRLKEYRLRTTTSTAAQIKACRLLNTADLVQFVENEVQ